MAGNSKSRAIDMKLGAWMRGADVAQEGVNTSLCEFYANCEAGLWEKADQARQRAVDFMEAHCDNIAAIHRALKK